MLKAAAPYLIEQRYEEYTPEKHELWSELVRRRTQQLGMLACRAYREGYEVIGLREDRLPNLSEISNRLAPRTGWRARAVSGFLPAPAFFEMLAVRQFPTTTWLRSRDSAEYIPEPDIFHDVFGHVPMHAHPVFANFLEYYGSVCSKVEDAGVLEQLGRLFWYTVEFGLIRENGEVKVYGSGIISSHRESTNIVEGRPEIRPFDLGQVLQTPVIVDELQRVLYIIDDFNQIYAAMELAEKLAVQHI